MNQIDTLISENKQLRKELDELKKKVENKNNKKGKKKETADLK